MNKTISLDEITDALDAYTAKIPVKTVTQKTSKQAPKVPESLANIKCLKDMLAVIDPDPADHGNRVDWRNMVWGIADLGWSCGYDIALEFSERGDLFDQGDFDGVWDGFQSSKGITYRSIFFFAQRAGYSGEKKFPDMANVSDDKSNNGDLIKGLVTTTADQMIPLKTNWLIEDHFPLGMISLIGGNPGMGKSQIAIKLVALVTSGYGSPLGAAFGFYPPGSAIILANEDDAARTIRPRLEAAGANLKKVHIVDGVAREGNQVDLFQLDYDVHHLREASKKIGDVKIIVIDPPNAYIGGKTDTHKDADVRRLLAPLQSLAHDTGAMILLVVHLNKRSDGNAHQRFNGTTAWPAVARTAYLVGIDEDTKQRFLLPVKNNLGDDQTGFGYEIMEKILPSPNGDIKTSHIVWTGKSHRSASDLLATSFKKSSTAVDEAKVFLESELMDGTKAVNDLRESAKQAGISWSSIRRAREDMLITPKKTSNGWEWTLIKKSENNLGEKNV